MSEEVKICVEEKRDEFAKDEKCILFIYFSQQESDFEEDQKVRKNTFHLLFLSHKSHFFLSY
jgi:hypothetical protein